MEFVLIVMVALLIWSGMFRYPPRYQNFRGPECGDVRKVQRDHLRLFTPPAPEADEEDFS